MNFDETVEIFAVLGLAVAVGISYLKVNKLWSRRHIREVAESISVAAALLGLVTAIPFVIKFAILNRDLAAAARFSLTAAVAVVFFLVGIGLWVQSGQVGFWQRVRRALRLERDELGTLIHSFTRPREAEAIVRILSLMSRVDEQLDKAELELMISVARPWGIHESEFSGGQADGPADIFAVRDAFLEYLALKPPRDQVQKVADLVGYMAEADKKISREERLVMDELDPVILAYLQDNQITMESHEVLVVPQSSEQLQLIRARIGPLELLRRAGGEAFVVGTYFSRPFALEVCRLYRKMSFFTTVEKKDDAESRDRAMTSGPPKLMPGD